MHSHKRLLVCFMYINILSEQLLCIAAGRTCPSGYAPCGPNGYRRCIPERWLCNRV